MMHGQPNIKIPCKIVFL